MRRRLKLTPLEVRVFNEGERLIPGRTHNRAEVVRHRSSYWFFRRVIERDLLHGGARDRPLRILDLGSGVGHGTCVLAGIPGVELLGLDGCAEAVEYARLHYAAPNVTYRVGDAREFLRDMEPVDYLVSRHMLEHVEGGIELALTAPWTARLLVNVPYHEEDGNPHHHVTGIGRESFPGDDASEFFFEDMDGVTFTSDAVPAINSIVCARHREGLPPLRSVLEFPFPAWRPDPLEDMGLREIDDAVLSGRGWVSRARTRVGALLGRG